MRRIYLLILTLTSAQFAMTQDTHTFNFTFNHMALSVSDVNKSAQFYAEVLHLTEITNRTKMDGIRWFSLGEGKELHLISLVREKVTINKGVHLALTTTDIEAFITSLNTKRIAFSDWPGTPSKINIRADGFKQIYLQDPDDYWIEVNNVK